MRSSCAFLALLVQTFASEDIFTEDGLSLLQLRAVQKSDEVLVLGQVTSEQACRDLATQWGMQLGQYNPSQKMYGQKFSANVEAKGCWTYTGGPYACVAFYGTGGDEAAQLAPPAQGGTAGPRSRLDATMQAQCAPNLAPGDDASATGDPHLTTNTDNHFDISLLGDAPPAVEVAPVGDDLEDSADDALITNTGEHYDYTSNLQVRAGQESDEVLVLGQVTSEQACRDLATQWGMQLGQYNPSQKMYGQKFSANVEAKGCWTYTGGPYACVAFYGTGGDEAAQLAPPAQGGTAGPRSRLDATMQAQCAPNLAPADDASATGDPHLTTNTGNHYDYTQHDNTQQKKLDRPRRK